MFIAGGYLEQTYTAIDIGLVEETISYLRFIYAVKS